MSATWSPADLLALDVISLELADYNHGWTGPDDGAAAILTALRKAGVWVMAETGPTVVDGKAPNGEWASGGPHAGPRLSR